ncbi:MAG TPA: DUF2071 domain-containing protein [Mycobacteriales bacterium]|nr:DUF2071 domain-containing protein [Mycobacteriales bacterium]
MTPGVSAVAPALPGRPVFDQRWTDLAFLHWPVPPFVVAPYLPPGVRPDIIDGVTYVGLIPFHMRQAGLGRGHPGPYLGDFLETNVRLYGVDEVGHHSVVFRSLEASRLLTVLAARWGYRLPYVWSRMRVETTGDTWTWSSRRRWPKRGLRTRITVRVGEPVLEPTDLDVWLTARWGLHHSTLGRTWWTPNHHEAWPLRAAEAVEVEDDLLAAAGFDVADEPPVHVRFSSGVRTVFGRPRQI